MDSIALIRGVQYTTLTVVGWLWLQAYGIEVFVYFIFLLFVLSGIDVMYGLYLAHRHKIITSSIWADGMMRKLIQLIISVVRWVTCYSLAYASNNDYIDLVMSVVALLPLAWFIFAQFTSIIENLAIGARWDEKWRVELLLKIAWIGRRRIELKTQRYTKDIEDNLLDNTQDG